MKIYTKQIDPVSLTAFITGVAGASFSGQINSYLGGGGYLGVNAVWASGGAQDISGQKTFVNSPNVPYSGGTGQAPSRSYVDNQILASTVAFSGTFLNAAFVSMTADQNISGNKSFTGAVGVGEPVTGGQAATKNYVDGASGVLRTYSSTLNNTLSGFIGSNYSIVKVTGSNAISIPNFTGIGGLEISLVGNTITISGGSSSSSAGNGDGINLSGNLASTGQQAWNAANNNGINLSGRLNVSGRALWDNDINLSGSINSSGRSLWDNSINLSGNIFNTGANLSDVSITGGFMQSPNFTGMGGTLVIRSGNFVLISGAGGGGGSNVSVTGSSALSSPNFSGIGGTLVLQSGNFVLISGGGVAGGAGGVFYTNTYDITGTGVVTNTFSASGNITNTFNVTSGTMNINSTGNSGSMIITTFNIYNDTTLVNSGTTTNYVNVNSGTLYPSNYGTSTNTYSGIGTLNNVINISGVTGNFVNISYFYDENNLSTGLNTIETFVSREFYFTGFAVGAFITGTHGFMSGSIYQRDIYNTKQKVADFSLQSGSFFTGVGGFSRLVSGMSRVGIDIFRLLTGATGVSIGVFGAGY